MASIASAAAATTTAGGATYNDSDISPSSSVPYPWLPAGSSPDTDNASVPTAVTTGRAASPRLAEDIAEQVLATYVLPLIVLVGTFGNVTSVAVLLRRRMRRTSVSVYLYLVALAFADFSVLYLSAFKTWIKLVTGFELLHVSSVVCSLVTFLLLVSLNLSAWLIVLTTVDRFVAIWIPLHAVTVCSRRRALLAVFALTGVIVLANAHVFWTNGLQPNGPGRFFCGPPREAWFMRGPFEYIKLTSYCIAPFIVILTLNSAIVARLRFGKAGILRQTDDGGASTTTTSAAADHRNHHHHPRQHPGGTTTNTAAAAAWNTRQANGGATSAERSAAKTARVTYMLLTVSITWLVLTAPWTLHTLFAPVPQQEDDRRIKARYRLVRSLCFMLVYVNHAVNFYLYCITGRKFRRELRDMFAAALCCCRPVLRRLHGWLWCCCCCCGGGAAAAAAEAERSFGRGRGAGGGGGSNSEALSFVTRHKNVISGADSKSRSVRTYVTQSQLGVNVDTTL